MYSEETEKLHMARSDRLPPVVWPDGKTSMESLIDHIQAAFPRMLKAEKYGNDMITSRVICLQDARDCLASAIEALDLTIAIETETMRLQGRKI